MERTFFEGLGMNNRGGNPPDDLWACQKAPPRVLLTPAARRAIEQFAADDRMAGMVISLMVYTMSESRDREGNVTSKDYFGIDLGAYHKEDVPAEAITDVEGLKLVLGFFYHNSEDEVHIDYVGGRFVYADTSPEST